MIALIECQTSLCGPSRIESATMSVHLFSQMNAILLVLGTDVAAVDKGVKE